MSFTNDGSPYALRTTADGSHTLFDPATGETYHSSHGALSESRHVFLEGSGVADRLRSGGTVRVLEVGLGTGLNLLLTVDAAVTASATLHYRALEAHPPQPEAIAALQLEAHLANPTLLEAWLEVAGDLHDQHAVAGQAVTTGTPRLVQYQLGGAALLEVALGDAASGPDGAPTGAAQTLLEPAWADAIYHDAFSIRACPPLWSTGFLNACAAALAPGGVLVSYSVAGVVRRRLGAAGLKVEKRPGPPGGKREMSWACRSGPGDQGTAPGRTPQDE